MPVTGLRTAWCCRSRHTRALPEKAEGGRPRPNRTEGLTGRLLPRRVRLSQALSDDVDELATAQGRTAAELMWDKVPIT